MRSFCTDGAVRNSRGKVVGLWTGRNVKIDPDSFAETVTLNMGKTRAPRRGKIAIEAALRHRSEQREKARFHAKINQAFRNFLAGLILDGLPAAKESK